MIKAVLFDLDGTLLPMDMDEFLKEYFHLLTKKMEKYLEPQKFIAELMAATFAMINNTDPETTNEQVFLKAFFSTTGLDPQEIMPIFHEFYETDYCQIGKRLQPEPLVKEIIKAAAAKGLKLVLATNPLFPLIAIKERLLWAGLDPSDFDLITSYEEMHACKPHLAYYREILAKIKMKPEHCLMVGNDVEEDLVAKDLGMQTFLVEEYLLNRKGKPIITDYRGSIKDLYQFIVSL